MLRVRQSTLVVLPLPGWKCLRTPCTWWSAAEVDEKLHAIMHGIHAQCVKYGTEPDGYINYVKGANIAGFMKVAHAMMGQGVI